MKEGAHFLRHPVYGLIRFFNKSLKSELVRISYGIFANKARITTDRHENSYG